MHRLLRLLPPEAAHTVGKWLMKRGLCAPGICTKHDRPSLFGTKLNNSLGLAAGFDKNGELVDIIQDYGFAWVEVGSVTLNGGPGNSKPRLFRWENGGLLNRMGLNGDPAFKVVERLIDAKSKNFAVNIAKTHDPDIMGDRAIDDIVGTYSLVGELGIYTTLNISCPNTQEGKTFEDPDALKELLTEIQSIRNGSCRPLVVKFSPLIGANPDWFIDKLIGVCEEFGIQGYIAGNTDPLYKPHPKYGRGGLSGPHLLDYNLTLARKIRQRTDKIIIGCGGIDSGEAMRSYFRFGANFFQAYTGFVRGPNAGPRFAHTLNVAYEAYERSMK